MYSNGNKKFELEKQLREQNVLKSELESLKSHKKIFVQQPNSNVFFLGSTSDRLSECKKKIYHLEKELKTTNN